MSWIASRCRVATVAAIVVAVPAAACGRAKDSPKDSAIASADLLLRGGAVYTVDAARTWATAVGVRGGRIIYVGSDSVPPGMVDSKTEVVDLAG